MDRGSKFGLVLRLAIADLAHDRLLTFCLAAALAAVVAPLLVLFALRTGVIETMRSDLVEDPVYREIRPAATNTYTEDFIVALRNRDDVDFVTGNISQGASVIRIVSDRGVSVAMDMLPSGPNDTLLEGYNLSPPGEGEIVLSGPAAEKLQLSTGEGVRLTATRTKNQKTETVYVPVTVSGVLPVRADDLARAYVPLKVAQDIEQFREGFAVPRRGWQGSVPRVGPAFDGVFLIFDNDPGAVVKAELLVNTGFFRIGEPTPEDFRHRTGKEWSSGKYVISVETIDRGANLEAIERLRRRLVGRTYDLFPWVMQPDVTLSADGRDLGTWPISISGDDPSVFDKPPFAEVAFIEVPQQLNLDIGETVTLSSPTVGGTFSAPVRIAASRNEERVGLPLALAALLRRGMERSITFDPDRADVFLSRSGYRGFRLYARSIDDVPKLYRDLEEMGISTVARVAIIERIHALDRGLQTLFWLIALISTVGGSIVLLASLYASVERKASSLALLRLVGFSRARVWRFPIFQGLLIAVSGAVLGVLAAVAAAGSINLFVAQSLGFEGEVATLSTLSIIITIGIVVSIAFLISLFAAARTTKIDPAEAIRVE